MRQHLKKKKINKNFILRLTLLLTFLWYVFFLPAVLFHIYCKCFLLEHSCPEIGAFEGRVDTQLNFSKWPALFTWGLLNNKEQKASSEHWCGFHHLSSAEYSDLATTKDKTLTEDCNRKKYPFINLCCANCCTSS